MKEKSETFGKALRRLRTEANLRQEDLAAKIGRSGNTIKEWEYDRSTPGDTAVADALCVALPGLRPFLPERLRAIREPLVSGMAAGQEASVMKKAMRLLRSIRAVEQNEDVIRLLREAEKAEMTINDLLVLLGARSE